MSKKGSRTEYFREYNRKRAAAKAAAKTVTDAGAEVPSPPPEATSGEMEDKTDLLDQFVESIGPKPNPRPTEPEEPSQDDGKKDVPPGVQPEMPRAPMALPPAIWQFADARLRQFFEKEIKEDPASAPTPLDKESARYLSEALGEGMAHSKMTMNPWYGFGIMVFMWVLPYLLLAFKKFGKKKKKEVNEYGHGQPDGPTVLTVPVPIVQPPAGPNAYVGEPAPAGGDAGAIVGDLATRDSKLAVAHDNSGIAPHGENNPSSQTV